MALESPAYVISADSHSAALFRQMAQSLLGGTGVVSGSDLAVSANGTPNMSVNVAAGMVWCPGTLGATAGMAGNWSPQTGYGLPSTFTDQGAYCAYQDGTVNLTIAAADPTNPRIDLVCGSIQDAEYSGSNNQPVLQVITGTPAATPSPPAAPASSVVLAQVAVAANATEILSGNITDERQYMGVQTGSRPAGRLYANSQTIVASGTSTQVTLGGTSFLSGDMGVSSSALVAPVTGLYWASVFTFWQVSGGAPPTGGYNAHVAVNGTAESTWPQWYTSAAATWPSPHGSDMVKANAGDAISLYVDQDSGSNVGVVNQGNNVPYLSVFYVGRV